MNLKKKRILITGASAGLGQKLACLAAKDGAEVIVIARRKHKLAQVAQGISRSGGIVHDFVADVANPAAVARVASIIKKEIGIPDIIINNAGSGQFLFTEETSPAAAQAMMAAPYFAAFNPTHAFMPEMLSRASGIVVNITSPASRFAWPGATAYTAARWAVRGFTEALNKDFYKTGLRAVLVQPPEISDSEYNQINEGSFERLPWVSALIGRKTANACALATLNGIKSGANEVVIGLPLKTMFLIEQFCPSLVHMLVKMTGHRHRT